MLWAESRSIVDNFFYNFFGVGYMPDIQIERKPDI